jgi:hypothetical protein
LPGIRAYLLLNNKNPTSLNEKWGLNIKQIILPKELLVPFLATRDKPFLLQLLFIVEVKEDFGGNIRA